MRQLENRRCLEFMPGPQVTKTATVPTPTPQYAPVAALSKTAENMRTQEGAVADNGGYAGYPHESLDENLAAAAHAQCVQHHFQRTGARVYSGEIQTASLRLRPVGRTLKKPGEFSFEQPHFMGAFGA